MNKYIQKYFEALNKCGVVYCHWKSNNTLDQALKGEGDLDLLIDPRHELVFSEVTSAFGFRLVQEKKAANPYVYHYFGLDQETGKLYHLHVYFKLVTGGAVLKNFHVPLEQAFLTETSLYKGLVPIPVREVDLSLFVIRKILEQISPLEHLLFLKDKTGVDKELAWLHEKYDEKRLEKILVHYLPFVPASVFKESHTVLSASSSTVWQRVCMGLKMHRCFPFTVRSLFKTAILRNFSFLIVYIKGKFGWHKPSKSLFPGGMIVAFVGAEATGKSTLSAETAKWLSRHFKVTHAHLGKPPKALFAKCVWPFIWCYVRFKKTLRNMKNSDAEEKTEAQNTTNDSTEKLYVPHPVVAWLNAINRAALAKKLVRESMAGGIVVTDRYPMTEQGQPDGPCLSPDGFWGRLLAPYEARIYARIPRPDIAIQAHAPLSITQDRNAVRKEPEPEDFIKVRHKKADYISFPENVSFCRIDTTNSFEDCFSMAKRFIWTRNLEKDK